MSKRASGLYVSGRCPGWRKIKTRCWREANRGRWEMIVRDGRLSLGRKKSPGVQAAGAGGAMTGRYAQHCAGGKLTDLQRRQFRVRADA